MLAASIAIVTCAPSFSQAPAPPKPNLNGKFVRFAGYIAGEADALPRKDYDKTLDDIFPLTWQHINLASGAARDGGVSTIAGASFTGSRITVAFVMPCKYVEKASTALLDFVNRVTPRTKLPASVRVEFSAFRGETRAASDTLHYPNSELSQ